MDDEQETDVATEQLRGNISRVKFDVRDGAEVAHRRRSGAWDSRSVNGRDSTAQLERLQETNVETQGRMDDEQEQIRLDGLRVLARIIARHALSHPHLYVGDRDGDPVAGSETGSGATATKPAGEDGAA